MYFVYALTDPRTQVVGYIGITDNPNERLQGHLSNSTQKKKAAWIEQLRLEGVEAKMIILEIVDTRAEAMEREIFLINQYAAQGSPLTNTHHLKGIPKLELDPLQEGEPFVDTIDLHWRGGLMVLLEIEINSRDQRFQTALGAWFRANDHTALLFGRPLNPAYPEDKWNVYDDVWGSLLLLPLRDDVISRILYEEVELYDIQGKDVLTYEPGKHYSCYVASVAYKTEKAKYLSHLLKSSLLYLCSLGVYIDKLYVSASLGTEETPFLRLIKEHFFGHINDKNVWVLDLNEYNLSTTVQEYQQCQLKGSRHIHGGEISGDKK